MKQPWANRITHYSEEPPDQLLAHPMNARIHPLSQAEALKGVLTEVGIVQNVICNETTGHVLDGHLRISLALRDRQPTVPVTWVRISEDEEKLILATLDPLSAAAAWDREKLDDLLRDVSTGDAAVQQLLADLAESVGIPSVQIVPGAGGDDFDVEQALDGDCRVQFGDLWTIGGVHRVCCGDSTDGATVARVMGNDKAVAIVTDPPYGMNLDTDWSDAVGSLKSIGRQHQTKGNKYAPVIGDDEPYDPAPIFEFFGYCKEIFLWGADYYAERIPNRIDGSWLVWDKRKETQAEAIGSEFELCWSKAKHKRRMLRHDWFGFLSSSNGQEARNRVHPTQKPTSLIEDIIDQWTDKGIVVDMYLGSGTTLIAAHRTNRRCYGLEIEPRYCEVVLKRAEAEGLSVELTERITL